MYYVNKSERHGRSFLNFLITYKKLRKLPFFRAYCFPKGGTQLRTAVFVMRKIILSAGGITPPLCAPFLLCEKTAPDGALLYQNVEVFAEAIQAEPSLAVQQAWNVSVNADKSITLP